MSRHRLRSSASFLAVALSLLLAACTEPPGGDGPPEGYTRFEPPTITVEPGTSNQWVQYVAAPFDQDMDVVDLIGDQGPGGHHAILYASPNPQPIGTTREWTTVDQIADRFLGGLGGSGAEPIRLPEGAVFRIPRGYALYINTHYFNVTDQPIDGWSRLDVKLEPASPDRTAVGFFTNVDLALNLPPDQQTTRKIDCTVERDLDVVMFTNHMHEYGATTQTHVVGGNMIKDDPVWSPEWAANPNFERHTLDHPLHLAAGTTVETSCTWDNTSNRDLTFPDEMCVFLAFHLDPEDVGCVDSVWRADGE